MKRARHPTILPGRKGLVGRYWPRGLGAGAGEQTARGGESGGGLRQRKKEGHVARGRRGMDHGRDTAAGWLWRVAGAAVHGALLASMGGQ